MDTMLAVTEDGRLPARAIAGTLLIIGGAENKDGATPILERFAELVDGGGVAVATLATEEPREAFERYRDVLHGLGVRQVTHLDVPSRDVAFEDATEAALDGVTGIFFTGGGQLRISSQLGDSPVFRRILRILANGGVEAGTSAGASVMSETMLVAGDGAQTPTLGTLPAMAPGLGLLAGVVVDQHFSERGRIGRLLAAIGMSPRLLGLGLDEDTAVQVRGGDLEVLGSGGVYVLDASNATWSNLADSGDGTTAAVHDVRLHLLSAGDRFDLIGRQPVHEDLGDVPHAA